MIFIPDVTDTWFIASVTTKMRIEKCEGKQNVFLNTSSTTCDFTILGLDYHHPKLGKTLRQVIMGLRAASDKSRNLML